MAFWGIELQSGKPYTYQYDGERGRLHLSQATLGSGTSNKKSIVQCKVGDNKPIYLCSMFPEKLETCPLNHEFEEDEEVTFSVVGSHNVHLSGFFYGESHDHCEEDEDDYGSDSYDEGISETDSEADDVMGYDSEDDDDDDSMEYDLGMFPPSPARNSGVKIEEIVDDEKPASEKRSKKKKNQSSDIKDLQIVAKNGTDSALLESEDEDGFPISSPSKSKSDVKKSKSKSKDSNNEKTIEEAERKKANGDANKSLKRKLDAVGQDGEQSREVVQPCDSAHPNEMVPETDGKQKKKNKKKTLANEKENATETGRVIVEQVESTNLENGDNEAKKNKKNKKKESAAETKPQQSVADKSVSAKSTEEKAKAKSPQARTFPNGLVIEEVAMGKPDGKRACPGKKVSVHYIGKLKKNDKIFDSNIGRAPFKFRLGVGQVIKGWDVGVNGMRVGDKRRLTIPPAMGYGAKGAGGAIPPNAWLVFDVELVDVN